MHFFGKKARAMGDSEPRPPMDAAMVADADESDADPSLDSSVGPLHQDLAPEVGIRDDAAPIRHLAHTRTPGPTSTMSAAAADQLVAPSTTIYATTGSPTNRHHPRRHRQYATPHPDYYAHAFGSGGPAADDGRWKSPRTPARLAQIVAAQLPPLHEPRYHHAATLFASLVLTSGLAFCSGFDAYMRCGSVDYSKYFSERWTDDDGVAQEMAGGDGAEEYYDDAYVQNGDDDYGGGNNDDDNNNNNARRRGRWLEEAAEEFDDDNDNKNDANYYNSESCDEAFKEVLVPATIVGAAVGIVALLIVAFPRKRDSATKNNEGDGSDGDGGAESRSLSDPMRQLKSRQRHLVQCLQLFVMSCLALVAWVYCIVFLMLEPRGFYNINYKSLAAIDGWGRVGDNANLYFSAWASLGLSCGLSYELAGMCLLQWRSTRQAAEETAKSAAAASAASRQYNERSSSSCNACPVNCHWVESATSMDSYLDTEPTKAIETVLDWSTAQVEEEIRDSRTTWYNSLYKLRARTGIWVSTLIASLIVCASSARMWRNIIVPAAELLRGRSYYVWYGSTDVCDVFYVMDAAVDSDADEMENGDGGNDDMEAAENDGWNVYDTNGVNYNTCTRTELAGTAGLWCSILSAIAIIAHAFMRRHAAAIAASLDPSQHSVHDITPTPCGSLFALPTELGLSMLNALVLGSSAIFVTGVEGPAQRVGNLYFSIWVAFLLSMRIAVACLEQMFNVDDKEEMIREQTESAPTMMSCGSAIQSDGQNPAMAFKQLEYKEFNKDIVAKVDNTQHGNPLDHSLLEDSASFQENHDDDAASFRSIATEGIKLINERPKRLRRWGSLAVFSSVCAAAAYDAGQNEPYSVTAAQRYMFILPLSVACLCYFVFALCLNGIGYVFVDDFKFGGLAAIVTFLAWLSNIVVTMHAKTSFAVNSIGEIKFANLYFSSWFSMIIAGLQMKTYTTKRLGMKPKSLVLIMWFAIVKVTFVMFGAGLHIWLNIADTCKISDGAWQKQPLSFCNRTVFAVAVGITGTVVAFVIMIFRALRKTSRVQVHVEMFLSGLFVIIFGVAAFIITSIGGPGQSVGDLYIATWLSFLVSIGVCISCYDELLRDDWMRNRRLRREAASATIELASAEVKCNSSTTDTPYQRMDG